MKYRALAVDYDGTLASGGKASEETVSALVQLREEGTQLLLVTGRVMDELQQIFPRLDAFNRIVAENGGVLYRAPGSLRPLGPRPPEIFFRRLVQRGVAFISGRVIVATTRPFQREVFETIDELQLDLDVIFNKDAVMVLPQGIHKGSGLEVALQEVGVEWSETVGIGDAENDLDFLSRCGLSVAPANALAVVREEADLVTSSENGAGVREAIHRAFRSNGRSR